MSKQIDFRPVILAGGSGTRFWPRSRRARAKQVLALDGERSMIQQTVERLKPLAGMDKIWVITNEFLAHEIADQLLAVPAQQIVQEPVARNTAPACGLAAFLIERENPEAVLGIFPSDHVIADEPRFLKALQKGIAVAAAGDNMVVLGIEPTRAETGYGYIETGDYTADDSALHVRRFTEKPKSGGRVCGRGKLLLELGDVSVVGEDAGERGARALAGDGAVARKDCSGLWDAGV
jgi:mannose-1-phosphate guanylyltransferase